MKAFNFLLMQDNSVKIVILQSPIAYENGPDARVGRLLITFTWKFGHYMMYCHLCCLCSSKSQHILYATMDVCGSTACVHITMMYTSAVCLLQANRYVHWRLELVYAVHPGKGSLSLRSTLPSQMGKQRPSYSVC